MEWISIDDQLPSVQTMVLLYAPLNYHTANGITHGWYDSGSNNFRHFDRSHSGCSVIEDQMNKRSKRLWTAVTHWMPLPDPPQENRND